MTHENSGNIPDPLNHTIRILSSGQARALKGKWISPIDDLLIALAEHCF